MLPDRSQSYMFNIYFLHFSHPEKPFTRSWFLSSHSHFENNSFVINYRVTFFVSLPFICHVICDNDFSSELFNAFHRAQRHTHTHRKKERERERESVRETLTRTLLWFEAFVGHFPPSLYVYFSFPPQRCGISVHFSHILRCAVSTCVLVCVCVRV